MPTLKNRVQALENIDTEVMSAVGSSLREIIQKNDDDNQNAINEMAHDVLKNVVRSFPEHAQKHVLSLFQKRIKEAYEAGYHNAISPRYGTDKIKSPNINDLFGLKGEEDD